MGCTFLILLICQVGDASHTASLRGPVSSGNRGRCSGNVRPSDSTRHGPANPLPTSVVPQDLAMYINEVKRDKETLKKISEFQSSIENLVS